MAIAYNHPEEDSLAVARKDNLVVPARGSLVVPTKGSLEEPSNLEVPKIVDRTVQGMEAAFVGSLAFVAKDSLVAVDLVRIAFQEDGLELC